MLYDSRLNHLVPGEVLLTLDDGTTEKGTIENLIQKLNPPVVAKSPMLSLANAPKQGDKAAAQGILPLAGVLKHNATEKHAGGRPRKESGYSRVTDWRRRKETSRHMLIVSKTRNWL